MKTLLVFTLLLAGVGSSLSVAASDSDDTIVTVKDSALSAKVKTKLLAKHLSTLADVKVESHHDGDVWLSGTAPSRAARDMAEEIAKGTDGVRTVHNNIVVD
ncbi:MAG TPA: BON domain-containing protein [Steroidobacteraceae bacterium]|jgi:hyperosmotically inducible protein